MSKTGPNNTNETLAHANRRKLEYLEERLEQLVDENEQLKAQVTMLENQLGHRGDNE